jgi:starch synthase (maltosyl-transferring)
MRNRTLIENVQPEINNGQYDIKRIPGELVVVTAHIFGDGHDHVRASLLYRHSSKKKWKEIFMEETGNDEWTATFKVEEKGFYHYKVEAWMDHLLHWYDGFKKKQEAGQDMKVELQIGTNLLQAAAEQYPKTKANSLKKLAQQLAENDYDKAVSLVMSADF